MITKKIGTVLLSSALIVSTLPSPFLMKAEANTIQAIAVKGTTAVSSTSVVSTGSEATASAEDLEKIINTVKSKITIPSELSNFSYNYYSGSSNSNYSWNLNWSNKDNTKTINVNSDSKGRISNFNYYTNASYKPVYLQEELKDKADAFIKNIAADVYSKLQYTGTASGTSYNNTYTYQYQRVENGIPMPDNTVNVSVNYQTGEVTSYYTNWLYDVTIPASTVKITKEAAAEKIGKNIKMSLFYQSEFLYDTVLKSSTKAFLVYGPDNSYIAVDAVTGKVYTTQNVWLADEAAQNATYSSADKAAGASELTPEEATEVDSIKGLISKSAAVKAIKGNTKLLFDKNMTSVSANLYKNSNNGTSSYVWNINFSDPRVTKDSSDDTYRAYAYGTVDAKTGKILSYYSSVKGYYNASKAEWETAKVKYTSKQGKTILESLIKEQIPEYFKNATYTGTTQDYVIAFKDSNPVYGGYSYNYSRVNEGITYAANSINGSVDGVTGKVYSFGYNWDTNITFEAPTNIISADKAFQYYIANEGYRLVYEVYYANSVSTGNDASYKQTPLVRLVYRTDISPNYISPFTGKQLDYDGKEYTKPISLYSYTDIDSNSSARNIKLLANMGIGFEGGLFKPTQSITATELTDFITKTGIYIDSTKYKLTGSTVSRLDAAKFTVRLLGLEKAAKITGIYTLNISDQASINSADTGYAAIAYGLKLLLPNSSNQLRTGDSLTRQEAADLIVAMLSAQE